MDDLNFIVQRLNSEPFNLSIRAVEFEEKAPDELLQLLIDIVSSLDDRVKADVSVESKDEVFERLFHFLSMHKYKLLSHEFHPAEWMDGIGKGQHTVSILCWVLRNYDNLKKRVYLANYLQPINVPEEYLNQSDSNLAELVETYNDLQADFVDLHKEFERVSSSNGPSANDLLRDLDKMKAEKHRLVERLEREHKQARGNTKFELLLKEVSRLRELNDKEIGLYEQRQQQHDIMSLAKKRLEQVHLLSNTLQDVSNDPSEIEKAINHSIIEYEKKIAQRHNEIELKIVQTDNSHQDCEEINKTVVNLEDELERKLSELDELKQEFDLEKLRPFQQVITFVSDICSIIQTVLTAFIISSAC
jgi:intraflagellar transport protein 81